MNRSEYSRWNDEPARRQSPPAQPPGWVDPPQHVAPPTRPQPFLDPDPYYVEEEVEPRVPFSGWESMRDRWDQAGNDPISHRAALIGAAICALVIAIIVLLAAPRPATTTATPSDGPDIGSRADGRIPPAGTTPAHRGAPQYVTRPVESNPGDRVTAVTLGGAPPTGAIGTVLIGGWATWYEDPRKSGHYAAAGPGLREALGDWRGRYVTVEAGDRSVVVHLTDWCACGQRGGLPTLLDLGRSSFMTLADPALGVIRVSIELDGSTRPDPRDDAMRGEVRDLPATDAATPDAVGKDGRVE